MSQFITELDIRPRCDNECIWVLDKPLLYYSSLLKSLGEQPQVAIQVGFETDLASVPRIPFIYALWGGRAHKEGVLHDYLYRKDAVPCVPRSVVDRVFLEAMEVRGKPRRVRYPMYLGVRIGGWTAYHKRLVGDKL